MCIRDSREGKTIIVVTHEPDVAAETKRNVILKDGVIESDESVSYTHLDVYKRQAIGAIKTGGLSLRWTKQSLH